MTVDAAAQGVIDALQGSPAFASMTPKQVRGAVASFVGLQKPHQDVAKVIDESYDGPGGRQPLRIYLPRTDEVLPVVVYFHGGGFIGGDLSVAEEPNRALANDAGVIVVAASYRLAPEHPFPAATDDTLAALQWAADNIGQYGGDPSKIVVMGDSAGGNLAAVAAQRAKDDGGPHLSGQILIYPVIDANARLGSRAEFGEGFIITAADIDSFWGSYLSDPQDAENPLATPSKAASLAGLPPALVVTTEYEVARDEAEAYAAAMAEAGTDTETLRVAGLIHGAYWMSGAVPRSREIHDAAVAFIRRQFAR